MKNLKFKLFTIVIAIFWGGNHLWAQTQFSKEIDAKLTAFERKSDARFLSDDYEILKQKISFFYSQRKLELSEKQNYSKRLYATYMQKFLGRSYREFNGSEWNVDTLKFIRKEMDRLKTEGKREGLFEDNSVSAKKLNDIKKILNDYDKINRFVATTKKISYDQFSINDTFPIIESQKLMSSRDAFWNKQNYPYTTKCSRLNEDLRSVTKILFGAHVKYLERKLDRLSECYKDTQTTADGKESALYASQPIYCTSYYEVMKNQLRALKTRNAQDDFIYKGCDVIKEFERLVNKLDEQNDKAYEYFESKLGN